MTGRPRRPDWGNLYNRAKLLSGLTLFTFLASHLLNHALGLMSLQVMERAAEIFVAVWRSPPGTLVLYLALLLHPLLALSRWLGRGHYRGLPWQAWAQLLLGLCVPPMLVLHVLGTRGMAEMHGLNDRYAHVLNVLFVLNPASGLRQNLLLLLAWGHGCIGMYYWLRMKPLYERAWPFLYAAALLLPALAMLGYVSAGRAVRFLLRDPAWAADFAASLNWPGDAAVADVYALNDLVLEGLGWLLLAALLGRLLWSFTGGRRNMVSVSYPDGRVWRGRAGSQSLLEVSRTIGYPHASVCGGQGRCSTCRVRLSGPGAARLAPASAAEAAVLARVQAPPGVRLACQVRPTADLSMLPMLPAGVSPKAAYGSSALAQGSERRVAILFADLRGFTKLSDGKLPFDVVFVLNQYFKAMGEAVERSNGRLDKFIGDGVMALFGLETDAAQGSRDALSAAGAMGLAMIELNAALHNDLGEALRIGIGIHVGRVIVGEMGHGRATGLTAIGDAVNTASRLESATKDFGAELVISAELAQRAGLTPEQLSQGGYRRETVQLRGKAEPLEVYVLEKLTLGAPPEA